MNIQTFLNDIDIAWSEWQNLIAALTPAQLSTRKDDHWAVKDHIAHITWYEREMITVAREHKMEGSPWWDLPFQERTEAIFMLNKDRTLDDILAESQQVHADLRSALATLTDDDLSDASLYQYMPEDWLPLGIFAGSTNNHYREHAALIREWFAV